MGLTCFDMNISDEINFLLKNSNKPLDEVDRASIIVRETQQMPLVSTRFVPGKPPIVRGWAYKTGTFFFHLKRRYFVLNPDEGTFIR